MHTEGTDLQVPEILVLPMVWGHQHLEMGAGDHHVGPATGHFIALARDPVQGDIGRQCHLGQVGTWLALQRME